MTRLCARLRDERGWGLMSSVLVVGILLSLSLPLMSLVDTQQVQSAHERKSESSFNLAEAALDASVFVLGKDWPVLPSGAYPSTCTSASTSLNCPTPSLLTGTYSGGDYTNAGWTVQVRDDELNSEYYDPTDVPANPTYDANGNSMLWVRADAHASAGDRTVVALVRRIDTVLAFPRNAITAGYFVVTTGGNKVVVDTQGETAQARPVAVRCTVPPPSAGCAEYRPENNQVSPDTVTPGYAGATVIPPEMIEQMRAKAKALDTYFTRCPQSPEGQLVFIEDGNCTYAGGSAANSADSPGMIVNANGTLAFGGGMTYYGMVYAPNLQGSTGEVVTVFGGATVVGSIAVDGAGGVRLGSNGRNLVYADAIFPNITTFSGAAPVQGSWRELPAS